MEINDINDEENNDDNQINNSIGPQNNNNCIKNGNSNPNVIDQNSENEDDQINDNYDLDIENIDEDLYMQELYLRLAQMKQERKEAENNAKLLDNRLNLLKGEEKKAWKKIENTKLIANNKLQHLQHIVKNNRLKEEEKKQKEKGIFLIKTK